jgi:outer membrane protein OmpA-like peptidoglycan-associated protein
MRSTSLLGLSACALLAALTPVLAQGVDSGMEVRVNPAAARPGGATLLYPGGQYSRNVPALLYPGERGGPIDLHMPGKHHAVRAEAATPRKPRPAKVAKAAPATTPPPAPSQPVANPYLGGPDLSNLFGQQAAQPKAPPPRPQPKLASAAPPPVSAPAPSGAETGLTKRSVILFAKDAADPAEGALGAIKFLAGDLNAAMTRASSRVELQAFGGAHGDKGSDARRLSLKRALAIRAVLIQDGLSADRIDVRAMGGSDDTGPADRVDVFVRG